MSTKEDYIKKLMIDEGMSREEALEEWINSIEPQLEMSTKKKTKKKNTKVASNKLRSPKDKKFMGHTGLA
tara:strand:- start:665 stop:874 length:210 start_codon:yes stop_codon:yes gene_type:complete